MWRGCRLWGPGGREGRRPGGRLWVGGQYLELSEAQTAAGEGLERRLNGEGMEEKEQLGMAEDGGRTKRVVGPGLASMYGNWDSRERAVAPEEEEDSLTP